MKKNNLLQTIDSWGPFFKVTFDLMVHSKPTSHWSGLLAFKGNGGSSNVAKYGDRAPAIFYNQQGHLHFTNAVSGKVNYAFNKAINLGKWYRIEIEQASSNGKVGSIMFNKSNTKKNYKMPYILYVICYRFTLW